MGENTETSNVIKFTPKPLSVLFANWTTSHNAFNNLDCSSTSSDDSDNSSSLVNTVKAKLDEQNKKELSTSTPKVSETKEPLTVERIIYNCNKENNINNSLSNRTYPNKDSCGSKSVNICKYPSSEVKKRNVLMPHDSNKVPLPDHRTPIEVKLPSSNQKIKVTTPVIKSGIRRFTPSSTKKNHKMTPQKQSNGQIKESVRCLFPEKSEVDIKKPLQAQAVLETPINKRPLPPTYAATPSHPQGVVAYNSKVKFKTTNIKGKNYIYIKKLGIGGSSIVHKVLEVGTYSEYAVKSVNLATDKELVDGYINEVRLLRKLQNSDRVIKLYDYEYDRNQKLLNMVLEAGETDLSSFLKARGTGLSPVLVVNYWEEMLLAVNYIHEHGVIHADLKPANFLLVSGRLKLIDFGIASAISSDATSVVRSLATGTYSYISPEALGGGGGPQHGDNEPVIKISFKSDVWSLGCILYSMVYGHTPFSHFNNLAKLAAILNPDHRIEYPPVEHLPPTLIASLKCCLTYKVSGRPTVRQLLAVRHLAGPRAPLPAELLQRLRPHLAHHDFALLQRAHLDC